MENFNIVLQLRDQEKKCKNFAKAIKNFVVNFPILYVINFHFLSDWTLQHSNISSFGHCQPFVILRQPTESMRGSKFKIYDVEMTLSSAEE